MRHNSNQQQGFQLSATHLVVLGVGALLIILVAADVALRSSGWSPKDAIQTTQLVQPSAFAASLTPIPSATPRPTSTQTLAPTRTSTPTATPTPTPTPLPLVSWKELGYLTSLQYTATTMVEMERAKTGLGAVLGPDRVLLMAAGKVHLGVNLTQVTEQDVQIYGTDIYLVLPRASVIGVELLPEQSVIYEAQQSWLFSDYEGLEVEEQARTQLSENANNNQEMLALAEKLARLQLVEFLQKLGYQLVIIDFR